MGWLSGVASSAADPSAGLARLAGGVGVADGVGELKTIGVRSAPGVRIIAWRVRWTIARAVACGPRRAMAVRVGVGGGVAVGSGVSVGIGVSVGVGVGVRVAVGVRVGRRVGTPVGVSPRREMSPARAG